MKTRITSGSVNTRIVGRKQFQLEIPSDVPAIKAHMNDIGKFHVQKIIISSYR
jgi:hypothetical protein